MYHNLKEDDGQESDNFVVTYLLINFSVIYLRGGRTEREKDSMTLSIRTIVCTNYLFISDKHMLCRLGKVRKPISELGTPMKKILLFRLFESWFA